MTDTQSLIEKLKAGSGPDRELDVLAMLSLYPGSTSCGLPQDGLFDIRIPGQATREVPSLTNSLDACLGLMREVLPDAIREVFHKNHCYVCRIIRFGTTLSSGSHAEEARALLIAILQAVGDAG